MGHAISNLGACEILKICVCIIQLEASGTMASFEGNHQAINFYLKNGWSITMKQEDKEPGFIRVFFEKKV